jgi:hypothetical protein
MRRGAAVFAAAAFLFLASCSAGGQASPPLVSAGSVGSSPMSHLPESGCRPAPSGLGERIEATLAVRGATLSRLFVGPASNVTGGPGEVRSDVFRSAWWVAALISGVGPRPEVGVWLVSGPEPAAGSRILAADDVAQRYSVRGPVNEPIRGDGLDAVRACVGTPPEP